MQIKTTVKSFYMTMSLGKFRSLTISSVGEDREQELSYGADMSENWFKYLKYCPYPNTHTEKSVSL